MHLDEIAITSLSFARAVIDAAAVVHPKACLGLSDLPDPCHVLHVDHGLAEDGRGREDGGGPEQEVPVGVEKVFSEALAQPLVETFSVESLPLQARNCLSQMQ